MMETKNPDTVVLQNLEVMGYEYYYLVPPTGHGAGGLALFWKKEINLDVFYANANLLDTCIGFEGKTFFACRVDSTFFSLSCVESTLQTQMLYFFLFLISLSHVFKQNKYTYVLN